jgi:hypothetical protein
MPLRLKIYILAGFALANSSSCQTSTKQRDSANAEKENILNMVSQLQEFKQTEKRVDSINKISKVQIKLVIEIMDSSFLEEDKGKNISLAFITAQYPYDNRIIYTVKFDKDKKSITSIDKNGKQLGGADLPIIKDMPLPPTK